MEFFTMSAKLRTSSEAPPTSAPSTSGWLINSRAFDGFTLPPYWMRTRRATVSPKISASRRRTKRCTSCAWAVLAVLPVPIAQTGQTPAHLRFEHFLGLARLPFRQRLADANDRLERGAVRRQRLFRDQFI